VSIGRHGAKILIAAAACASSVTEVVRRGCATFCGITTEPGATVGSMSDGRGTSVNGDGCWLNTPGMYGDGGTAYCASIAGWSYGLLSTSAFCICSICCVHFAKACFRELNSFLLDILAVFFFLLLKFVQY